VLSLLADYQAFTLPDLPGLGCPNGKRVLNPNNENQQGNQYKSQAEFILMLQAQIEALKSDVKKREMRIKQLSEELQKLKEIDMQRRPSRPPE